MLWILDTDHVSILQRQSRPEFDRLTNRLQQPAAGEIAVTLVSFQEQVQGWMTYLNKARTAAAVLDAYDRLQAVLQYYSDQLVLPFDTAASDQFAALQRQRVRVSTLDLRIAGIALARNATLLTRNLRDFRKVPGLVTDDWTS